MARLLVVDDSATSRAILSSILSPDHELRTCSSGEEAVSAHAESPFDAILLDLLMPGMDGRQVLQAIRAKDRTTPILIVTADIQETTKERILALGASAVLNKPLTKDKVTGAVEALLAKRPG